MIVDEPLFFKNKNWYDVLIEDGVPVVKLTDEAPQKAIDSYNEYFKQKEIGK